LRIDEFEKKENRRVKDGTRLQDDVDDVHVDDHIDDVHVEDVHVEDVHVDTVHVDGVEVDGVVDGVEEVVVVVEVREGKRRNH
jgi:hypothetical protein